MTPLLLLVAVGAYELGAGVTPVQKVIAMMQDMAAKGRAQKEAETVQHTEYMQWCTDTTRTKKYAIRDNKMAIEKLTASGEKADADSTQLGDEIAELDANIAAWSADKQAATQVRDTERADYNKVHTDYSGAIDAMERALNMLASKASGAISNTALLQMANTLPHKARTAINAFLEKDAELMPTSPAGNSYEFGTSSIQDTVNNLKDKMEDERSTAEQEESGKKHSFQMLVQQLTMDMEAATDERDSKLALQASRKEDSAAAAGESAQTTDTKTADEKYLADLTATCEQKASEYVDRQALREGEAEALAKAIEIMSGDAVSGASDKHLPALLQGKHSFALRASKKAAGIQKRVATFLQGRAVRSESRLLSRLATRIQDGPFDKVRDMIQSLINKLAESAAEEADHKAWCDGELQTNTQTRQSKSEQVDRLTAQSEKLSAEIAMLAEGIAGLNGEVSAAQTALTEATAQRNKEHAANTEAVEDAKGAIVAVRQALSVLKEFYAHAATATSFAQQPASWDSSNNGQQSASTGVLGMLEVCLSDFVRLESETSSSEAESSNAFDRFSGDTNADIDSLNANADEKAKTKTGKEKSLNDTHKDLRATQEELDSAQEAYGVLKKSCIDAGVSYKDRVQRREEEIESLKEALQILGNEM